MRVVIFGATGLVGNELRHQLHTKTSVEKICIATRREIPFIKQNEELILSDFKTLEEITSKLNDIKPEYAFCCLGTTIKKAGSKDEFYKVDHDLIVNTAKAAFKVGVKAFGLISSIGANEFSPIFYLKVKGKTEKEIIDIGFEHLVIIRPSLLVGKRTESRPLETLSMSVAPLVSKLLMGPLKKFRPVSVSDLAGCLIRLTTSHTNKVLIIESHEIL